jgi:predicted ferric reductase
VNEQLWWYVARSGGIVAWALLTVSVVLGLSLSTVIAGRRVPKPWLLSMHRYLGLVAIVMTGFHLAGLVADSYVHFDVIDLLVPYSSQWQPGAVAWGVVAMWLLLAVEITSLLRRRIPKRLWRWVHVSSLPLFAMATAHTFTAGTDASHGWLRWGAIISVNVVAFLSIVRIVVERRPARVIPARPSAKPAAAGAERGSPARSATVPVDTRTADQPAAIAART